MTGAPRDRRLTPARPDLAAAHLEGAVTADRYVVGKRRMIITGTADLRQRPRSDAPLDTQALYGEELRLYDEDEGWGWVQLERDGYVGYVPMHAIGPKAVTPTHVVTANRTFVYPAPDMKTAVLSAVPLGSQLSIAEETGHFSKILGGGFVFSGHIAPRETTVTDFVSIAERIAYTPYLWGGKTPQGIDCSGLVQLSLALHGSNVPRDTDMQEKAIGTPVSFDTELAGLRRGDIVFWRGHVGIMRDADHLIHANAHHMMVATEPLRAATDRIFANSQAGVTSIRRVPKV